MGTLLDLDQFYTGLIFDENKTVEESDGKKLAIGGPIARTALGWSLLLVYISLISLPKTEIDG